MKFLFNTFFIITLLFISNLTRAETKFKRVITLSPALTEMVYTIDAGEYIVGVSDFTVYPPEALEKPKCGGLFNPNLEKIISLRPDLVIIQGKQPKLETLCNERNIEYHNMSIESIEDIKLTVQKLGEWLDQTENSSSIIKSMDAQILLLKKETEAMSSIPETFIVFSRRDNSMASLMTIGGDTFISEMISLAGGKNIFSDLKMYPQISKETLIQRKPKIIIELRPGEEVTEAKSESINKEWDQFPTIPAVQNNRIHIVTKSDILMPTPRVIESIKILKQIFEEDIKEAE